MIKTVSKIGNSQRTVLDAALMAWEALTHGVASSVLDRAPVTKRLRKLVEKRK